MLESRARASWNAVIAPMGSGTRARRRFASHPHRRDERLHADDIHDASQIISEHVQRHLGRYILQPLHQEVCRAHAHLQRPERVFDCLAAAAHGLRIGVEALLRSFHDVLVLPTGDDAVPGSRTARFEQAGRARIRIIPVYGAASVHGA